MTLHHGSAGQETLFSRISSEVAGLSVDLNCFISGSGSHFFVLLSHPKTHVEEWAWAGTPDSIVSELRRWLLHRE
jgi:hypothetical protein